MAREGDTSDQSAPRPAHDGDAHERRAQLASRLNSASLRLEAYCLLTDVLREKLEAIEIGPDCLGDCRRCPLSDGCAIKTKIVALEASVAELNRNLSNLHRLLGPIGRDRS